jgi:hypothetical protein
MNPLKIDFAAFNSRVLVGRPRGEAAREKYDLDSIDKEGRQVEVTIPNNIYSVNSSFFLGLFGKSIVTAGSRETFFGRYHFSSSNELKERFEGYVSRALQEKGLFDGEQRGCDD